MSEPLDPDRKSELRSAMVGRWFHDVWPLASAATGIVFILVDFFSTGAAHLNGLAGIGMAFCGVLPVVHYDRARKG